MTFIMNNLNVIDALDKEYTVYKKINDMFLGVQKYSFKKFNYPPLFQLILPNGIIQRNYFVTEEFVKIVKENNRLSF